MGNKEFKGVNPVLQIKDTLDTMSNDQYDNYKSSEAFAAWCAQQGFDEVPDDRCAAEQILDELTEEQVEELHAILSAWTWDIKDFS